MRTRDIQTRFMSGNVDLDGEILDILTEAHGYKEVVFSDFDTDNAIYSNGFIYAIEEGKTPELELHESHEMKQGIREYHHVIINDVCYFVYFN